MSTLNTMVKRPLGGPVYALKATMPNGDTLIRYYATEDGLKASVRAISRSVGRFYGPKSIQTYVTEVAPEWMKIRIEDGH